VVTGGVRDASWITPTLLEDVPLGHPLWRDEVFGPVTVVQPFDDLDDAIRLANGVDYGLQAGIFTGSLDTALTASQALDAGTVLINDTSDYRLDSMPFGGSKKSGIGREGVRWAMTEFSEPKVVCFNRAR
jgi:glyceraldehyde-3-phosphate dehydrogenase (NADP+)